MELQVFKITSENKIKTYELIKVFKNEEIEVFPTINEYVVISDKIYKVKKVIINYDRNTYTIHVKEER